MMYYFMKTESRFQIYDNLEMKEVNYTSKLVDILNIISIN